MLETKTSECDDNCRNILNRYAAGAINEHETRALIAAELHTAGIAGAVAGEQGLMATQLYHDLTDGLEGLLYKKVMGIGSSSLNLDAEPGQSVTGWARNLLRTARQSEMRNIHTRGVAHLELVDPQPEAQPDALPERSLGTNLWMHPAARFHSIATVDQYALTSHDAVMEETMSDAADWLQEKARHLRDNSRLEANAATLRHAYGVPALVRPNLAERRRLAEVMRQDPFSAHRSIKELRAIIGGESYTAAKADSGLLALWCDYSYDHLDAISSAQSKVSRALVDAVLADRPRPSRAAQRSFRSAAREFGSGKGWARLIDEACECFIALEFEACSSFDTTGTEFREARIAGQTILQLKADDVFARVLAWPGQAFGSYKEDLYEKLDALIRSMTDLEVEVIARKAA